MGGTCLRSVLRRSLAAFLVVVLAFALPLPAGAAPQNDAGTGGDAGNTFETATTIVAAGFYTGRLERAAGDRHDFYQFFVRQNGFATILLTADVSTADPILVLDPNGVPLDVAVRTFGLGVNGPGALQASPLAGDPLFRLQVSVPTAPVAGNYRLHLQAEQFNLGSYTLCFQPCEGFADAPQDLVFGGSLKHTKTRVLLIPPTHGDLGNPLGPTVLDYLQATQRGIHRWETMMDRFATDHPAYAYLRQIDVDIEILDGPQLVNPAGYDVIIGYLESSAGVFRGIAVQVGNQEVQSLFDAFGLGNAAHFSGRFILLSLLASSPRVGQTLYDYPEVNDLEIVTMHEFGHTFGLGHTRTWTSTFGPDLMNSPAPFVYGDGNPVGDGGERTAMKCLSSLNLYGMAVLYRWIPSGNWQGTGGSVTLPSGIAYSWYC